MRLFVVFFALRSTRLNRNQFVSWIDTPSADQLTQEYKKTINSCVGVYNK